jgi:ribonuclease HII
VALTGCAARLLICYGDLTGMYCVGIDENGLGPRLGPLTVTAIMARTTSAGRTVAHDRPKGRLRQRLGDSKELVSFGDSVLGEAWARAVAARARLAPTAGGTVDELVHALSLDPREELRAPCPTEHADQCWSAEGEELAAAPALVAQLGRDLDALARTGVDVVGARVAIVCTRRLNDGVLAGESRFDADLHAMERLVLRARQDAGEDVNAICGKVGGFDRYADRFGPLGGRLHVVLEEGRARSAYHVAGVGEIAFVRDADATSLLVSMASLVGKWVRDTLMRRIIRHHQTHAADAPDASGYHDPVTTRFIRATEAGRRAQRLPETCFVRTRLEREARPPLEDAAAAPTSSPKTPKRAAKTTRGGSDRPRSAKP